jgi:predicted nucleic acid-binding protein
MEVLQGATDKRALYNAIKRLKAFPIVPMLQMDLDWARSQIIAFNLSHNVQIMDCLIASTSYRLQIPLYTKNLKHFRPLLGQLAVRPY